MFSFTRLVPSKVQDTASNEQLDLGPGNKYTHSLEGLTREKATLQDADRQKWVWQAGYKSRWIFTENSSWDLHANTCSCAL